MTVYDMTGPTTTAKQDVWFVLEGKMCAWCVSIKFMMMVVTIVIAFILRLFSCCLLMLCGGDLLERKT